MPRNSQGLYQLPAGNPVISGSLIESVWANSTMNDMGDALTNSLPRNGAAPMTGPLTLSSLPPTQTRHATSKAYVDSLLTYATGLPIGAIIAYGGSAAISGFLLCNGQPVSRTTYAALFGTIGVAYGAGDGVNTFNLPDLQNEFIRGKGGSRTLGSKQAGMVGPHNHSVTDPIHTHVLTTSAHNHNLVNPGHTHPLTDPGHNHGLTANWVDESVEIQVYGGSGSSSVTGTSTTGITVGPATTAVSSQEATQNVSIAGSTSGVTVAPSTGAETVPQNTAMDYYIKAVQDSAGPAFLTGVSSSDLEMIAVDTTLPNAPVLVIKSNTPFGTVKLDQNGKVPLANSQSGIQSFLGLWDASTGLNPSQDAPTQIWNSGDTFLIGVLGTIDLYDPSTQLSSPVAVNVGDEIIYISNSTEQPNGWYYVVAVTGGVVASQVQFIPEAGISSANVQGAIAEVQGNIPTAAAQIAFTPGGTVQATDVQAAIAELGTEKLPAAAGAVETTNLADGSVTQIKVDPTYEATLVKTSQISDVLRDSDIGVSVQAYDATTLKSAAIGTTVQAFDADTVKSDVAQIFTATQRTLETTDNDGSFDCNINLDFECTPTAGFTLTFANIPASPTVQRGSILLVNGANYAVAAHANTKVTSSLLTTISATGTYILAYETRNGLAYVTSAGAFA